MTVEYRRLFLERAMSNNPDKFIQLDDDQFEFDALRDLEHQTSNDIRKQRKYERKEVKAQVILQSGNSSELLKYKIRGVIGNISEGGCGAMFPIPIGVGDIYRLTIDRDDLDLPLIFARCRRCLLVHENAYEAGFSFFTSVKLAVACAHEVAGDLL